MPTRVPMTERQRGALLALPANEDEVVRYHSLESGDLAAIAEARTPETRLSYHPAPGAARDPAISTALSLPYPLDDSGSSIAVKLGPLVRLSEQLTLAAGSLDARLPKPLIVIGAFDLARLLLRILYCLLVVKGE